ncbi:SsgA family sporulation/cell division regulator [Streptomyces sp. NPDC012751]|uniref:SsgA family sporulation/cell division regulator n=1 Tax=unclassified Streptomyces TaxID=2593676 RepID=UPI000699E165|nr:SsgA family sporulation/cell division regulator [Streptomyces sp. NRRL S-31]
MEQQWAQPHREQLTLFTTLHNLAAPPESATVTCRFGYVPASPYCVRLDLASFPDDHVTWVIGRDLLLAGTEKLSGDGDVKIWPSRQRGNTPSLYLRLERPYVTAMFATELDPIRQWLMETYIAVPAGRESLLVDWDALAASRRPPT